MLNKANRPRRKRIPNVGPVARLITLKKEFGKGQVRISNPNAPDLKTLQTVTQIQRYKHHPVPSLLPNKTTQKTSFATTPIRLTCLSPTIHQIGRSNKNFSSLKTTIDGLSLCCLAAADGKSYNYYK